MKKFFCMFVFIFAMLNLAACNNSGESANSESEEQTLSSPTDSDHIIIRDSETDEPLDLDDQQSGQYTYLTGSRIGWSNGEISWWYNPAGQPTSMTTQQVIDGLIASTKRWEAVCGVTFKYQGLTSNTVRLSGCDRASVVGWAPLAGSTVGQAQACYSGSYFNELDMALDNQAPLQITSISYMTTVAVHEFGHTMGLGHTTVNPAVMTAILSTGNPVQDDIQACQSIYGLPSTTTPAPTPTYYCQPNSTRSCQTAKGYGSQTCSSSGSGWSTCKLTSCKPGYRFVRGNCRR